MYFFFSRGLWTPLEIQQNYVDELETGCLFFQQKKLIEKKKKMAWFGQ